MPGMVHAVISALERGRQVDQKLKAIDYMGHLRPAEPVRPPSLKNVPTKEKTSKRWSWVFLFFV